MLQRDHAASKSLLFAFLMGLALLCMRVCTAQQAPSYLEKFAIAGAELSSAGKSGKEQFLEDYSFMQSSTHFQEEMLKWADLFMLDNFSFGSNISEPCFSQTKSALIGLAEAKLWALKLLDFMGKPSPNVIDFNFVWPGAYKECLNFTVNDNGSVVPAEFTGQYCTAFVALYEALPFATLSEGICVPSSCSSEDVSSLLQAVAKRWNKEKLVTASCQQPNKPLSGYAVTGIVICSLFAALMIVSTLIDVLVVQMPKWRSNEMDSLKINSVFEDMAEEERPLLSGLKAAVATPEPGLVIRILVSFSVYTNGSKLLNTEQSSKTLACVHGIRFFSMTWVFLGHTFITPLGVASNFFGYFQDVLNRWSSLAITNAPFSVDTFFLLSGLLVAFLSLKEMKRRAGRIDWAVFYFHRFWRLTPPYMLVLLLYVCLGPILGSGPMWPNKQPDQENCKTTWWTNLLYVNNFVELDKSCMGHTWYLANDMQFYVISPLIFVPFYYSLLYGLIATILFLIATTVTPGVLSTVYNFPASLVAAGTNGLTEKYMHDLYIKPYNRMGPYIVGMVTGYLLYYCNCKIRINRWLNIFGWIMATAVALAVVYGLYEENQGHPLDLSTSAFYNAVSRTAWGACVAWVIFACVTGNGGFVNTILSWSALVPLSRLTYCVYLVHILVMSVYFYSRDTPFYFSDENLVITFLGLLFFTFMVAAVVSLAFETPMMALEKVLLNRFKRNGNE